MLSIRTSSDLSPQVTSQCLSQAPSRCHPSTHKDILTTIMDHITRIISQTPSFSKIFHFFSSKDTEKSPITQTTAEYCKSNCTLGACLFFSSASEEHGYKSHCYACILALCWFFLTLGGSRWKQSKMTCRCFRRTHRWRGWFYPLSKPPMRIYSLIQSFSS